VDYQWQEGLNIKTCYILSFALIGFFSIENKFKNILHLNDLTFVFHYFYYSIASFCCF